MQKIQLEFTGNSHQCFAVVDIAGIADSWDADASIVGHPTINELHVKFWLGDFIMPVFSSREDAKFFEPLLEAIDEKAKLLLPKEFND